MKKSQKKNRKTNKSIKKRYPFFKGGAGVAEDYISIGFAKSPVSENTLSIIDIFKGPASIFGSINYAASNIEDMLGFLKSGFKDKEGNPVKIEEKKVTINSTDPKSPSNKMMSNS